MQPRIFIILSVSILGLVVVGLILLKAAENPAFCASCHIIRPYYQSWSGGTLSDHRHAGQDIACLECHQHSLFNKVQEGIKYLTGNYTLPLNSRLGERDFCFECHSEQGVGTSWEEIKAATAYKNYNPHDSHEGDQECNLCHKMHQQSRFTCVQCHSMIWMDELDQNNWRLQ